MKKYFLIEIEMLKGISNYQQELSRVGNYLLQETLKKYLQSVLRFRQVDSSPKVKVGHQLTGMTGAKPCKTAKKLKML